MFKSLHNEHRTTIPIVCMNIDSNISSYAYKVKVMKQVGNSVAIIIIALYKMVCITNIEEL